MSGFGAPLVEVEGLTTHFPIRQGLLGSIPRLDRPKAERLHSIAGMPPSVIDPPGGCRFRPRCPHAFDRCLEEPGLEARAARTTTRTSSRAGCASAR